MAAAPHLRLRLAIALGIPNLSVVPIQREFNARVLAWLRRFNVLTNRSAVSALLAFSLLALGSALAQATARPTASGDCPRTHPIKGNIAADGERIYHVPGGR